MINVNDLMIGNLIKVGNDIEVVVSIDSIADEIGTGDKDSWQFVKSKDIQPIEITLEWLGRLGFEAMSIVLPTHNGDKIFDWCDKSNQLCIGSIGIPCKYVHEVQNLVQTLTLDSTGGEV